MKSLYQRHMLYGMLAASLVVCLPTIIVAFWPLPATVLIDGVQDDPLVPGGQIEIVWTDYPLRNEPPLVIPATGPGRRGAPGMGNLVDNVILVDDNVELNNDGLGFGGAGVGAGDIEYGNDDPLQPGGGGGVYVQDTTTYELFSGVDQPPELIDMPLPEYPSVAQRTRMEGKVILHLLVDLNGRVVEVRVFAETNPNLPFAENAIAAAKRAVFRPAFHHGLPVRCWVSIPVEFELR